MSPDLDPGPRIDPAASIGAVRLVVADLERVTGFYEQAIGLRTLDRSDDAVALGVGGETLVELRGRPAAPARPGGTTGLFHMAILAPSRLELARSLHRVADAGWRFTGASDHLVSESLYLRDPEGNGIEIYRDRPRGEWPYLDGRLQMDTLPLDLERLGAEASRSGEQAGPMPPGTTIGHVHLNVADLQGSESFYAGAVGFDVTVRGYPGALFLAAGGYHHHLGVNTWTGRGAPPPPPGSRGLERFEVVVPRNEELERVEQALRAAGLEAERHADGLLLSDPSRNHVLLKAGASGEGAPGPTVP